ncbi:hypothetical protein CA267_003805 [Alteromonas pelagimontana]|uniref:Uncharacterized protein n=1 Tax=Alteromonas pelagimontana TaxID=1858656 RepID=A0A6M4MCU8_9ALTE|nr:hypothetical protein [Alteromonas pelagimontana]QJR79966.1 hypothetical protein CA267_003805 [Alteromonas pelagimontana]
MQTLDYFVSHTLTNFYELQEFLKSNHPIGMEKYKAKCSLVALNFNHTLEYLVSEKEHDLCRFLDLEIKQRKNYPSTKNQILKKLFSFSFNYLGMTVPGDVLKILYDVGDVSKHGKINRTYRRLSSYSQVEECLLVLLSRSKNDEYYSIHCGVMVTDDDGKQYNLEKMVNLGIGILSKILYDLGVIDGEPEIWEKCRSFDLTPEEADKTFKRKNNICELPQFGNRGGPNMLKQVFDPTSPQSIRFPKQGEPFNFSISVPIEVVSTPFLKKARPTE